MSSLAVRILASGQPAESPWPYATAVLLRLIAFCNPRKTGRHRMWKKHHVQCFVRGDWRGLGRWS